MSIEIPIASYVMHSNLFTMGVACVNDPRQVVPLHPCIPDEPVRRLRAQLILEEALETVAALGYKVFPTFNQARIEHHSHLNLVPNLVPDLEGIIDGCCDEIYVATGCLAACGCTDMPHLVEVCRANDRKFPGGVATVNSDGKYLKPEGWRGPDHAAAMREYADLDLAQASRDHVATVAGLKKA